MTRKWFKQGSAWLMAGVLASSVMVLPVLAADSPTTGSTDATVVTDADLAFELNILQGDGDGLTVQYLNKSTTRLQAAIILLRLKGLEMEAMNYSGSANFADTAQVWEGGQKILAYLKANPQLGWQGIEDGKFDPNGIITSEQLAKVLMEALGYKQDTDFDFEHVLHAAEMAGVHYAPMGLSLHNKDVATQLIGSLLAKIKGGTITLADQLKLPMEKLLALQYTRLDVAEKTDVGTYLTDGDGKALYLFKKDLTDLNSCQGTCLQNWPIFYSDKLKVPAQLSKADFGVLTRTDGSKQTTYKGWPLYYYIADKAPGDTTGQGVKDVWYLLNADTLSIEASKPQSYSIDISGFKFQTPELTISVGSTVTFTNKDGVKHNAAALDGSFRTELLAKGESATVKFDKAGVYDYVCEPHKANMKGKIIVK